MFDNKDVVDLMNTMMFETENIENQGSSSSLGGWSEALQVVPRRVASYVEVTTLWCLRLAATLSESKSLRDSSYTPQKTKLKVPQGQRSYLKG